jgi:hypothetical protein
MFQRELFFFLWKFAYHPTALGSYVLSSGPNTGRGAKDTYSEQVVRRVPKKIRDFIQGLRSHSGKGRHWVPASHVRKVSARMLSVLESRVPEDQKSQLRWDRIQHGHLSFEKRAHALQERHIF